MSGMIGGDPAAMAKAKSDFLRQSDVCKEAVIQAVKAAEELQNAWKGNAPAAFLQVMTDFHQVSTRLFADLDKIGEDVGISAQMIEENDQQLAKMWGGYGS